MELMLGLLGALAHLWRRPVFLESRVRRIHSEKDCLEAALHQALAWAWCKSASAASLVRQLAASARGVEPLEICVAMPRRAPSNLDAVSLAGGGRWAIQEWARRACFAWRVRAVICFRWDGLAAVG